MLNIINIHTYYKRIKENGIFRKTKRFTQKMYAQKRNKWMIILKVCIAGLPGLAAWATGRWFKPRVGQNK